MPDNTLLGRCCVAYTEAFDATTRHYSLRSRDGVRSVLEHLAAELVALDQSRPERLTAHEVARWLLEEVQR
jgi:hypothetical protein